VNLYKLDSKGKIRIWSILKSEVGFFTESGTLGGCLIKTDYPVPFGLASRNQQEQIDLMIYSKVSKKKDKGYCETIENAKLGVTNQLGFSLPMLATLLKKAPKFPYKSTYVQRKYNGHRCLIKCENGINIAYSRGGKLIESIHEILEDIEIPEGVTVDGELYLHGKSLQKISSLVRKRQPETTMLRFMCYDVIMKEPYGRRYDFLANDVGFCTRSELVHTAFLTGRFDAEKLMWSYVEEGYEGAILRDGENGYYEDGKRPKTVIKVKPFYDDEFVVVDILKSVDGWARLVCKCNGSDQTFNCSAPGTHWEKTMVLENKEFYIGKKVNVKYPELSEKGIPVQAVTTAWRDKENE